MIERLAAGRALTAAVAATFPTAVQVDSFLDDERCVAYAAVDHEAAVGWAYGYLLARPDGRRAMMIYEVEVVPEHRRRGHATGLVAALLQHGAMNDAFEVWVLADTDNEAARRLYEAASGSGAPQVLYTWTLGPEP